MSTLLPLAVATELLLAWLETVTGPLFAVVGERLVEAIVALVSEDRPERATTADPATPPVPPSIEERYWPNLGSNWVPAIATSVPLAM